MSLEDILTNVLDEIKGLRSDLKGAKAAAPAASKPDKPAAGAGKPATENKPAAGGGKPAENKPPKAATTPPKKGGKYNETQVREAVRAVATNASLGKQEALNILDEDGGGVQNVSQLKPEFYDAVYEACQVAINGVKGAGGDEGGGDPDDPLA